MVSDNEKNILQKINKNLNAKEEDSLFIEDALKLNENFSTDEKVIDFFGKKKNEAYIQKEKFEGERSYAIEANIVKILKLNKKMNINEIMEKVIKSIEIFKINISVIY